MGRAPYQVLVLPFYLPSKSLADVEFLIFKRHPRSGAFWQWISGGGEDSETPDEAARREGFEEGGIDSALPYFPLDSRSTIPRNIFTGHESWSNHPYVIPEYCFAVELPEKRVALSAEHQAFEWVDYATATSLLKWDSNRNALWELRERLQARLNQSTIHRT